MGKNNLQNHWQRHDWQTSPFAPDLKIVQALVNGKTASGAGFSRYEALSRCLGETAEIITLNDGESSEGLAAGPDFSFASTQALNERLERWALWDWWHGTCKAMPVKAEPMLSALRHHAEEKRETSLWFLPGFPHIQVVIARSLSPDGTQPILGFGANNCPQKAAQSALTELGLMELNLRAPTADLHAYFKRLTDNADHLFQAATPRPLAHNHSTTVEESLINANVNFTLHDHSPSGLDIVVVKADIQGAPSWSGTLGPLM
ncbi:MAG TPA: hypothetical protein EYG79_13830 [Rhodobacteraceae bacterium]|nr:hypothetical protein [Paracoccaceae bacterium]